MKIYIVEKKKLVKFIYICDLKNGFKYICINIITSIYRLYDMSRSFALTLVAPYDFMYIVVKKLQQVTTNDHKTPVVCTYTEV